MNKYQLAIMWIGLVLSAILYLLPKTRYKLIVITVVLTIAVMATVEYWPGNFRDCL